MSARRCSMCSIDYPSATEFNECRVCGEKTNWFSNVDVDPEWEQQVIRAKAPTPSFADKVYDWRHKNLRKAEYTDDQAFVLANNRQVDLHEAESLAKRAGPDVAYEILT